MEVFGINSQYLLLQICCVIVPVSVIVSAVVQLIRNRKQANEK